MLLRASPIRIKRMRRVAPALVALGALLLIAAVTAGSLQSTREQHERASYLQQVFFHYPTVVPLDLPFLTKGRKSQAYATGQTVLAFASSFQPYEPLFVRLYHRTQGLLDAYAMRADVLGQVVLARPLNMFSDGADFTPTGGLWFLVESLSGQEQAFSFRLEPGPLPATPPTKGVYPPAAVPGSVVVLWCSGQEVGKAAQLNGTLEGENLNTRAMRLSLYPVAPDGLLLASLVISLDDPTGLWTLHLGSCEYQLPVNSLLHNTRSKS
jgi:hypothetical protein